MWTDSAWRRRPKTTAPELPAHGWSVPARDEVLTGSIRISPGSGRGDDLDERVPAEEIIALAVSPIIGIWFLRSGVAAGDLPIAVMGTVFLVVSALIIRHLRSRVVIHRTGMEVRRVFRRDVAIPWADIDGVTVVSGPGPAWLNEWSSVCIEAAGRRHWVVQIRRPTDSERMDLSTEAQRNLWQSVDRFALGLDRLAGEMRRASP